MSEPFYRRIIADIRVRVASGEWPAGTALPSTKDLVTRYREQFGSPTLAHTTVRQAITILIETGELRGQQGLGVFVGERKEPQP
jgi:GntR family transcriptional regulator